MAWYGMVWDEMGWDMILVLGCTLDGMGWDGMRLLFSATLLGGILISFDRRCDCRVWFFALTKWAELLAVIRQ